MKGSLAYVLNAQAPPVLFCKMPMRTIGNREVKNRRQHLKARVSTLSRFLGLY